MLGLGVWRVLLGHPLSFSAPLPEAKEGRAAGHAGSRPGAHVPLHKFHCRAQNAQPWPLGGQWVLALRESFGGMPGGEHGAPSRSRAC